MDMSESILNDAVEVDSPEVAEQEHVEVDTSNEDFAKAQGWTDKETFLERGGDESRWVDADTFVKKSETELPVLRDRLRKTTKENEAFRSDLERQRKQSEAVIKAMKRQYESELDDLKLQKSKAREDEDFEQYDALIEKEKRIQDTAKDFEQEEQKPSTPQLTEDMSNWANNSQWFNKDATMTQIARTSVMPAVEASNPSASIPELLQKVDEEMQRLYPHILKPSKAKPPRVEGGRAASKPSNASVTINDLPQNEKDFINSYARRHRLKMDSDEMKSMVNNTAIELGLKKAL